MAVAERAWGIWTKGKLELLRRYLDAFTTATKNKTSQRVYLDLFAGRPENVEKETGQPLIGSAIIALQIDNPPFTRLRFFEMPPHAADLDAEIQRRFATRDAEVIAGDCNETIHSALWQLRDVDWAPTFAFIDPNGPHFKWTTLEALARHKQPNLSKVEMWILFPAGLSTRMLPVESFVNPQDARMLTDMFGNQGWRDIYEGRVADLLTPSQAREEYVNLMRWRLEVDLHYKYTHAIEVNNEQGASLYHMIFATDNDAGTRIMGGLYERAAREIPGMRKQARLRWRDQPHEPIAQSSLALFDEADLEEDVGPHEVFYQHRPPTEPWRLPESGRGR